MAKVPFYEKKSAELNDMLQRKNEFNSSIDNEIMQAQAQLAALSAQEVPTSGPCDYTALFKKQAELQAYLQILNNKKAQGFGTLEEGAGSNFKKDIILADSAEEAEAAAAIRPYLLKIFEIIKDRDDARQKYIGLVEKYEREIEGFNGIGGTAYAMRQTMTDAHAFRWAVNKTALFKKTVGDDV